MANIGSHTEVLEGWEEREGYRANHVVSQNQATKHYGPDSPLTHKLSLCVLLLSRRELLSSKSQVLKYGRKEARISTCVRLWSR